MGKMEKVAFFINNSSLLNLDCKQIIYGNPGVGGSEYQFLLVPYLLEQRENNIMPFLLVNFMGKFPHKNVISVRNLYDSCQYCINNGIKKIVIDIKSFDKTILDNFPDLSVIVWAHNTVSWKNLNLFCRLPYVKRIVNVSREQMELYRDHLATCKSTYVYNITPVKDVSFYKSKFSAHRDNNVVYMGSIVPEKGFHTLARVWKKILNCIPDAQLYVIGSGKLYNKNAKLGKYGIAQQEYEDSFMRYLTDENGNIIPSVHFMGILGEEKWDVLGKCKVGIPNPTGISETFCLCGIEMQLMGCNIVTIRKAAFLDTIMNHKYLYCADSKLADYVIKRMVSESDDYGDLYQFVQTKFGIEGNIERWENILIHSDECYVEPISPYKYHCKVIKNILFELKLNFRIFRLLPPLERICDFYRFHIINHIL